MVERITLKAPEVNRYMRIFDDRFYSKEYGQDLRDYMKKIREAVKIFKQGEDESICLWFSAPRGNIEDWADYEDMKYWAEEDAEPGFEYTRKDYEEEWLSYFPEETMYYKFRFSAYKDAIGFALGERCYFETREDVDYDYYDSVHPFFDWILDQLTVCAEKIKAGTYKEELENNVPFTMRVGTISRSTLWNISSSFKEWDHDELTQEEINEFTKCMKDNQKIYTEGMTSGKFFECCRIGYEANGLDCNALTDKEAYLKYSDGRDDGLSKIDQDSPEKLVLWKKGDLQDFNGHHPWEVFRGGNSTHVNFGIGSWSEFTPGKELRQDLTKSYLYLAGYHRQKEVVRMYLALRKAGVSVYVYDADDLVARLTGTDRVGIVPNGVTPRYCEGWFPGEHIADFMNIHSDDEGYGDIVKEAEWKDIIFSPLKTD